MAIRIISPLCLTPMLSPGIGIGGKNASWLSIRYLPPEDGNSSYSVHLLAPALGIVTAVGFHPKAGLQSLRWGLSYVLAELSNMAEDNPLQAWYRPHRSLLEKFRPELTDDLMWETPDAAKDSVFPFDLERPVYLRNSLIASPDKGFGLPFCGVLFSRIVAASTAGVQDEATGKAQLEWLTKAVSRSEYNSQCPLKIVVASFMKSAGKTAYLAVPEGHSAVIPAPMLPHWFIQPTFAA